MRLLQWTREHFARAAMDEPRLSAEVLLAHVMGCGRVQLYAQFQRAAQPEELAAFREMVKRAAAGEPVAYLIGEREFYSLPFKVSADVLIPRPETELLVDTAVEAARRAGGSARLWDACTGNGCVAVAAARFAEALAVLATDISEAALAVAGENVRRHGMEGRVLLERADLLSLPQTAGAMAPFDVITANPPYVSDAQMAELAPQVRCEPQSALRAGPSGLEFIRRIVADAPPLLRPSGTLAVEIGTGQAEEVHDLLCRDARWREARFLKDAAGIERVAVATRSA